MPPKRKLANSEGPTSKRRANNEATPLEEANTAAMGQDPPQPLSSRSKAPINYDLLAAAIIKQSQQPPLLPLQNHYSRLQIQLTINLLAMQLPLELPSQ